LDSQVSRRWEYGPGGEGAPVQVTTKVLVALVAEVEPS
jgi:hypothetical protein